MCRFVTVRESLWIVLIYVDVVVLDRVVVSFLFIRLCFSLFVLCFSSFIQISCCIVVVVSLSILYVLCLLVYTSLFQWKRSLDYQKGKKKCMIPYLHSWMIDSVKVRLLSVVLLDYQDNRNWGSLGDVNSQDAWISTLLLWFHTSFALSAPEERERPRLLK